MNYIPTDSLIAEIEDELGMSEWRDYQKLVLSELRRLNKNFEDVSNLCLQNTNSIQHMKTEIAVNRIKSGFFGTIGGGITLLIAIIIEKVLFRS